jgi:Xaa-Pro aminopeptidase
VTSVESLPAADFSRRLETLGSSLESAELDGLLVGQPTNIRYLCGFSGSAGALLVYPTGAALLVTDFRYEEQAASQLPPEAELLIARDGVWQALGGCLDDGAAALHLGFEADWLTMADHKALREHAPGHEWRAAPPLIAGMRAVKEPGELARMEFAARIAESALGETLSSVEEGAREVELAAELEYQLRKAGSGRLPFEVIVAGGPRSSLPHAEPTERYVREGDLLLFDFGASVDGYCSDITRTVVLGAPSSWQREAHEAVREAQRAAIAAIAQDVRTSDVDRVARETLDRYGLADRFGHSTGHGIGLEVHEAPRLSSRSEEVLVAGHVVTVEPGVYLPAMGGVRIEDDVVVEEAGRRSLTHFRRDLIEL